MRGATCSWVIHLWLTCYFNPRSPCGERLQIALWLCTYRISIHAPHAGSDFGENMKANDAMRFQSTLPMRGATAEDSGMQLIRTISIHAPHAGSDLAVMASEIVKLISIHAPHAGSDIRRSCGGHQTMHFNPRSPCGERRLRSCPCAAPREFQSTLPMRGATRHERRVLVPQVISIHAPHAGSDRTAL